MTLSFSSNKIAFVSCLVSFGFVEKSENYKKNNKTFFALHSISPILNIKIHLKIKKFVLFTKMKIVYAWNVENLYLLIHSFIEKNTIKFSWDFFGRMFGNFFGKCFQHIYLQNATLDISQKTQLRTMIIMGYMI